MTYLNNRVGNQVPDTEILLQKQANLCGADVVLDDLADHPDVVLVLPKRSQGFIDVSPRALDDESAVRPEDRVQILWSPKPRLP